jgi:hypothetical protein
LDITGVQKKMKKIDYDFGDRWNMSLMTLKRIDELLKHCQVYSVNNHVLGLKNNLFEIYKESKGWLNSKEIKTADKQWSKINEYEIKIENDILVFDNDLKPLLDKFDFWIRYKLHKKKVTFDSKDISNNRGLSGLGKKYNLEDN